MAQSPRESGSTETPPKPPSKGWYPAHHRHHTEGGSGLPASLPSLGHVSRSPAEHGAWAGTNQGPRELGPRRGGLLQGPCCLLERQRVTDQHRQCTAALAPHSVKCLLCVDWGGCRVLEELGCAPRRKTEKYPDTRRRWMRPTQRCGSTVLGTQQ